MLFPDLSSAKSFLMPGMVGSIADRNASNTTNFPVLFPSLDTRPNLNEQKTFI